MSYVAVYDRTIYYNPSNKYCVISVKTTDKSIPQQARNAYKHRDNMIRFVAVGYELPLTDKVSMLLDGEWKDGKNGYQLHVESCEEMIPQTTEGIKGYLSSCLKGIGPRLADEIVDRFGLDSLKVIEEEPQRLLEIRGISPEKLEKIQSTYLESRSLRNIMMLLAPYQVTPVTATKIYEHFGAKSVEILSENPYELCKVSGFGFKRVDAISLKNGMEFNAPVRIRGAIAATLDEQRTGKGHLYMSEDKLRATTVKLLNEKIPVPQLGIKGNEVEPIMEEMILKGEVVKSDGNVYQLGAFIYEDDTARKIAEILAYPTEPLDITQALRDIRDELGISLSQRQSEAVYVAFRNNLSIITGSPGTGKTTVLKAIIEVFKILNPEAKIKLAAPTGKASRRMAESTGFNEAKTLHSLLGLLGESGFSRDKEDEPLDADLIIVDESSMIDMWLARQFFGRIGAGTKVVMVGDIDQLQSVGAGDVFRELIRCGLIPVTVLNEIFRQSKDSRIAHNAKKINEADTSLYYGDDFQFFPCKSQEAAAEMICNMFYEQVGVYGIENVQILSPYPKTGEGMVTDVSHTWWYMLAKKTDSEIVLNNSWSGSTMCNTGYEGDCSTTSSFICRLNQLIEKGFFEQNQIDRVFVFGGSNDSATNNACGELRFSDWTADDLKLILPGICYFMDRLLSVVEKEIIHVIINSELREDVTEGIIAICKGYGIRYTLLANIEKVDYHPNCKGMFAIKEQVLRDL